MNITRNLVPLCLAVALASGCGAVAKNTLVGVAGVVKGVEAAAEPVYRNAAEQQRKAPEVVALLDGTPAGLQRATVEWQRRMQPFETLRFSVNAARAAVLSAGSAVDAAGRGADKSAGALTSIGLAIAALATLPPVLKGAGVDVPPAVTITAHTACATVAAMLRALGPALPVPCKIEEVADGGPR